MWNDALWSILGKKNEAVLPELQLYGTFVAQQELGHHSKHRGHGLGLRLVGGAVGRCALVALGQMIFVSIQVFSLQTVHQGLIIGVHQGVHAVDGVGLQSAGPLDSSRQSADAEVGSGQGSWHGHHLLAN